MNLKNILAIAGKSGLYAGKTFDFKTAEDENGQQQGKDQTGDDYSFSHLFAAFRNVNRAYITDT